jgi:ATP-dependent Lhr-like helicase
VHRAAATALADLVSARRVDGLLVERIDGIPVLGDTDSAAAQALMSAGFTKTPRGLRLR